MRSEPPSACCHTSVSRVRLLTTSPDRSASARSRSNSRRASSSVSPARVAVRVGAWMTSSPTRMGSVGHPSSGTPQHGPHAGADLVEPERLDDVVVGSGVEGSHHRRVVVDGGDDDDGHRARGADHADHGQAVDVGKPEVEEDDIGAVSEDGFEAGDSGGWRSGRCSRGRSVLAGERHGSRDRPRSRGCSSWVAWASFGSTEGQVTSRDTSHPHQRLGLS